VIELVVLRVSMLVCRACQSCIQSLQRRWWSCSTTRRATDGQTFRQT